RWNEPGPPRLRRRRPARPLRCRPPPTAPWQNRNGPAPGRRRGQLEQSWQAFRGVTVGGSDWASAMTAGTVAGESAASGRKGEPYAHTPAHLVLPRTALDLAVVQPGALSDTSDTVTGTGGSLPPASAVDHLELQPPTLRARTRAQRDLGGGRGGVAH